MGDRIEVIMGMVEDPFAVFVRDLVNSHQIMAELHCGGR